MPTILSIIIKVVCYESTSRRPKEPTYINQNHLRHFVDRAHSAPLSINSLEGISPTRFRFNEPNYACKRSSPSPSTLSIQRPHSSGCFLSFPTSSR